MMQYFVQEESMRLDDDDEEEEDDQHKWMDPLLVSMTISKSESHTFCVNQNEWPIRSWTMTSEEEEEEEEEEEKEQDQDDDIFVDGMEELAQEIHVTNSMQAIPSSSTLIQTLQDVNSKETVHDDKSAAAAALAIPHPLTTTTTKKVPIATIPEDSSNKKQPTHHTNSNKA